MGVLHELQGMQRKWNYAVHVSNVSQHCLCMKSKNQLHKLKDRILRKTKSSLVHLNVVGYKPPCSADTHQGVEPTGGVEQTAS